MPAPINLVGQRFGKLVVVKLTRKSGFRAWECRCDCGGRSIASAGLLRSGKPRSCGCGVGERTAAANLTHGQTRTHAYNSWLAMRQRCENPRHPNFRTFGGRGIKVCKRWRRFENFLADMGPGKKGLLCMRIDWDKNYSPSNCQWTPRGAKPSKVRSDR
jgi:hypothetical protein